MSEKIEHLSSWIRTLDVETESPIEGMIVGKIPEWLEGSLIRNGSGMFEIGETKMNHLFDGLSVMHRFAINGYGEGKSTYQNRILQSDTYKQAKAANRLTMHQFGTFAFPDPCQSLWGRFMARFEPVTKTEKTDNCCVSVCYLGDKLYAFTETPQIRQVDAETLETVGEKCNISELVAVNHSTAHPHVLEDGTVYNMGNSVGSKGPIYNIIEFPTGAGALEGAKIVASFPSRWKMSHSYYHSFGITENYFVFLEFPLILNTAKLLAMNLRQKAVDSSLDWFPTEKTRILLVERKSGELVDTIYEAPPFFCFHHGNCYEKNGYIIMDISHCKDATIFAGLSLKSLRENRGDFTNTYYTRFVLPLGVEPPIGNDFQDCKNLVEVEGSKCKSYWQSNKIIFCEHERLLEQSLELPRINYSRNGKEYRYVYGISQLDGYAEPEKILKLDLNTREVKQWAKAGFSPSEPVYVSRPESIEEDDGVLLFSAVDQVNPKKVLLIILNAATFKEEAVVEYVASGIITKDFHGIFSRKGDVVHGY
ncbi:carotenoid isomerooxygenase-like [Daphnia magna]|uniref:Beta,beta-carotene 15,15'-dioxygenase n=2 Tax=Daphnia magna TaxID=35525 RepID=A0A164PZL0_9CRUS|nr:carotenoid isomerooxygenase [Daphnia magna]XP_045035071.1 carotenoid isomerooxygenase-like [Daphnia magna]KAK4028772.1 hypothetical protein OUZ56_021791 [Daphnia magna]KZS07296.1 Beta,beta-carotene 15,15'-dioxygenase [Daphnia magna]